MTALMLGLIPILLNVRGEKNSAFGGSGEPIEMTSGSELNSIPEYAEKKLEGTSGCQRP